MEPAYQIVYSDALSEDYLKVYPGWIRIKKLRRLAYQGIGGAIKAGIAVAAHKELKHLENCISFDEIARIEVKPATESMAGIIQFYLHIDSRQTRANYLNLPTRTDAFHFSHKEAGTIQAMANYINRLKVQGYPSILQSRMQEIQEVTLIKGSKSLHLNRLGSEVKKELLEFLVELHDIRCWKKYSLDEAKKKIRSGSFQYGVYVDWSQAVQWNSTGIFYETDIVTIFELEKLSDTITEALLKM